MYKSFMANNQLKQAEKALIKAKSIKIRRNLRLKLIIKFNRI